MKEQSQHLSDQKNKIKSLESKVVFKVQINHLYVYFFFFFFFNKQNSKHVMQPYCSHFTCSLTPPAFRKLCLSLFGMSKSTACLIICPTTPTMGAFQVVRIPPTWPFACFSDFVCTECVNDCPVDFPRHCGEVFSSGEKTSGPYPVKPNGSEPFFVYCEFSEGKNAPTCAEFSPPTLTGRF